MARDVYSIRRQNLVSASLILPRLLERVAQPVQAFVETIARGGAGGLNELRMVSVHVAFEPAMEAYPGSLSQTVQSKRVRDLGGRHCILSVAG